jgi:hypothetical protein
MRVTFLQLYSIDLKLYVTLHKTEAQAKAIN